MKNRLILGILFVLVYCVFFIFTGCGYNGNNSKWFVESNYFHTNNVKLAQRGIPYTIILPTYFPGEMGANCPYQIDGPINSKNFLNVEIDISYFKGESRIDITEVNKTINMIPTQELDPIYIKINGVSVLRQTAQLAGSSGITEGIGYIWNHNGLSFSVGLFSINLDESQKVVESMIK